MKAHFTALERMHEVDTLHWSRHGQGVLTRAFLEPVNLLKSPREYSSTETSIALATTMIGQGDAYYVDGPIVDMLSRVSSSVPLDTPVTAELFPAPRGFVWLAKPVYRELDLGDGRGVTRMPTHAFSWNVTHPRKGSPIITFGCYDVSMFGVPVIGAMYPSFSGDNLASCVGYVDSAVEKLYRERGMEPRANNLTIPFMLSLVLFMRQRILRFRSDGNPDRATRRRLAKAAPDLTEPKVQVVSLRKVDYGHRERPEDAEPVEWSCHWLVSGHWRRQWYPRRQCYETIWIEPHMKGDLGKPFKAPDQRLFHVSR